MPEPMIDDLQTYIDAIEAQRDPSDNEIEAYARARNRVEADRKALDARYKAEQDKLAQNYAKMAKECDNRDASIEWKWGQMIKELVAGKIKGMKQRSIKTLFGVVGYRKKPAKVVRYIRDKFSGVEVLAWAKENCPDVVSSNTTESVVLGELPETCELIWIEDKPERDEFFWKQAKEKKDGE